MQLCQLVWEVSRREAVILWLGLAYARYSFWTSTLARPTFMYHAVTHAQAMRWPEPQLSFNATCDHNELDKGAERNEVLTCLNVSVQGLLKLPDGF